MAIVHAKVSGKPAPADPTLVGGPDWDAAHTIQAATITLAMLANISVTQRVIGRNSGGAGVPEEVTASQLLDWVSNTNGVLLTRNAGTWGAVANVNVDAGDFSFADTTPLAPSAGRVKMFSDSVGGRSMPGFRNSDGHGVNHALQPLLGQKSIMRVMPNAGSASVSAEGSAAVTTVGTLTARAHATTNMLTGARRVGYVSAASAGERCGHYNSVVSFWRGNASWAGGFSLVYRFAISDPVLVGTARMLVGMGATGAIFTDVNPSTLANIIGIGCDDGDTQMQLYAAGAAAQARTALGANFPVNTTNVDAYELALFCAPNASGIGYRVRRLNTGHVAAGTITAGASLPANTLPMDHRMWRTNGATAAAVAIDLLAFYAESDV